MNISSNLFVQYRKNMHTNGKLLYMILEMEDSNTTYMSNKSRYSYGEYFYGNFIKQTIIFENLLI